MDDIFNFLLQPTKPYFKVPDRSYSIEEFVNEAVTTEIDNCDAPISKALLVQIKVSLIDYLKTEYFKVPNEKFLRHVCDLTNLNEDLLQSFTKIFVFLEKIAIKMEKCRNFIKSPEEQRRDDELIERLIKQKQRITCRKEDSPEPPRRVICRDPRPVPCEYSPPKSMFEVKVPSVLMDRNASHSHGEVVSGRNHASSNEVSEKDEVFVGADETPSLNPSPPLSPQRRTDLRQDISRRGARSPSYYRNRLAESNASFNATASKNLKKSIFNQPSMPPRSNVAPITSNHRRSYSMFDSTSDNESEEEMQQQPVNKKTKRVGFDDGMVDNEGITFKIYKECARTVSVPLVDHHAVDIKYVAPNLSMSHNMLALSNQPLTVKAPAKSCYETWQKYSYNHANTDFEEEVIEVLEEFRYNAFVPQVKGEKRKLHLVIKDSLLFPTNFKQKYKQCLEIDAKHPQRMETITDVLEEEISKQQNDYFMKTVIFSMGLDLICHEPQLENAIKNLLSFLGKFVTVLQTAFHPDGPKCYKKNNYPQKNSFFRAEIPKLIILTIPYIDNHPTASTYKQKIIAMNDALRNYVKKNKAKLFKDHNFIIEIYDWEKESKNYRQCNRNDMESRFKILTTALSEKYQMFIVEQERPKNSQENDFQDSAED